jgi:hypothetical protein
VSLFAWLFVAHLVGDFLFQTRNMADRKAEDWSWLLGHIGVYMAFISVVVVWYTILSDVPIWLAGASLLFVAATHIVLDRRTITSWWVGTVLRASDVPWISIVVDQIIHILVLAVVAQVLVLAGAQGA